MIKVQRYGAVRSPLQRGDSAPGPGAPPGPRPPRTTPPSPPGHGLATDEKYTRECRSFLLSVSILSCSLMGWCTVVFFVGGQSLVFWLIGCCFWCWSFCGIAGRFRAPDACFCGRDSECFLIKIFICSKKAWKCEFWIVLFALSYFICFFFLYNVQFKFMPFSDEKIFFLCIFFIKEGKFDIFYIGFFHFNFMTLE